jgi:hypothetical protein
LIVSNTRNYICRESLNDKEQEMNIVGAKQQVHSGWLNGLLGVIIFSGSLPARE